MSENIVKSLELYGYRFGQLNQLDDDLSSWLHFIDGFEAGQLSRARKELVLAGHSAAAGLYPQAYSGLRLFLELSFAYVYFSVNEFEKRLWLMNKFDFSWAGSMDPESGLLSPKFVDAFHPALRPHAEKYASDAAVTYRECSQFIHGKSTHLSRLPSRVEYSEEELLNWLNFADKACEAVMFLLLIRFGDEVTRSPDLVDSLADRFGHLQEIRTLIGLAND